jgi:hypothetical protein
LAKQIALSRVFDRVGYTPHSGQRRVHEQKGRARFRVVCAGRRAGKSTSGGHELTAHAYEAYARQHELNPYDNRLEYWIVGPEYSDSEKEFRAVYKDLESLEFPFDHPGTYYDALGGNMHISLFGGRYQVHAKSAKYPDSLVGEGLNGAILAEAAKLKASIWPKYIRPMLIDTRGWALFSSTPEGKNWFYDAYMRRLKGEPGWWSVRMPSWVNEHLFPLGLHDPELASLAADLTEEAFKQEIGAEFSEFVGRVFKRFDEEIHVRPLTYNPAWATYGACDYGWTNPFVWLLIQVDHWQNVYVIGEFYKSFERIDEIPEQLLAKGLVPPNLRVFYPDPAEPGDTRVLESKLRIRSARNTGGELKDRLTVIRKLLDIRPEVKHLEDGHPEKQPQLFVDAEKCPKFVEEFGNYRYPKNKREADANDSELPLKKDDHCPEAFGRFAIGYFGNKEDNRRTRQTKVQLAR